MKKLILIILLLLLSFSLFAFELGFHMAPKVTLVRDNDFSVGGYMTLLELNNAIDYGFYVSFDYILAPGGSSTGHVLTSEFATELGAKVKFNFIEDVHGFIDITWYNQWIQTSQVINTFYLFNSGLMLRPGLDFNLFTMGICPLDLGIYYQMAVFPKYDAYDGFGFYLSIGFE